MNLNRKAMVLAVGAALAVPCAHAQVTSKAGTEWEFYGKFYPEITRLRGGGATATGTTVSTLSGTPNGTPGFVQRYEMEVNNTYLGFRGHKDIGHGLRGIWQVESAVAIDQGDGDPLANRDSFVGLAGGFGTLRLGNMDTPFKKAGDELGFLGVSSGNFVSTSNVMRKIGFNNNSAASFHLRRANAIDYGSPKLAGGLSIGAQYSMGNPDEAGTVTSSPQRDPRVISMAVKYERGPLYLSLGHEIHYDMFGGSSQFGDADARSNRTDAAVHSKDTATQVAVAYKIGVHHIEADYIVKNYKENGADSGVAGSFENYKNKAWMLVWDARWTGQWRTAAHYIRAGAGTCSQFGAACTTDGLAGAQLSAGVAYYLDPNFYIFGLYSIIRNGDGARFENLESGRPSVGEDITQAAVGVTYTF